MGHSAHAPALMIAIPRGGFIPRPAGDATIEAAAHPSGPAHSQSSRRAAGSSPRGAPTWRQSSHDTSPADRQSRLRPRHRRTESAPVERGGRRAGAFWLDRVRTEGPMHAPELSERGAADGYDVVVAVGGDGTANEVINGLMRAQEAAAGPIPAMGVLCVGRGNDFAFGAGIPIDLQEGCRALAAGRRTRIDIGRVAGGLFPDGRFFGNGVGVGFDAVVGFEALKMKRLHGFASYVVAALKTIFLYFRAPLVRLEIDGQSHTQRALMVSIMNGRRMGGGFMMAPSGRNDDGLFDLFISPQMIPPR